MNKLSQKFAWLDRCLFSIAGPILEKELRVCSRHKRNYLLRFVFVMLLTALVAGAWFLGGSVPGFKGAGGPLFQASRMAEVGRRVSVAIVLFQFVATQIAAAAMLSTAISEEVNSRTLAMLMTTPISSVQIVIGKLLSRLLHVVLLMAISLPLLSIIRVLGGVPWDYVVSSLCVTFAAAVFVASASLFFSTHRRQANIVIADVAVVCLILYVGVPLLLHLLQLRYDLPVEIGRISPYLSPAYFMLENTRVVDNPALATQLAAWPVLCGVTLLGAAFFLTLTISSLRTLALRQAMNEPGFLESVKKRRASNARNNARPEQAQPIRRVKGPPLIWRELKRPLARTTRLKTLIGTTLAVAVILAAYVTCIYTGWIGETGAHVAFVVGYMLVGLFRTASASATSLTSEKESGALPILLTTPLHPTEIITGKILGSFLKAWPVWVLLLAHILSFILIRYIHPFAAFAIPLLTLAGGLLVSAMGVFLSSCFRRSSSATTVQLLLLLVFCMPFCCPLPAYLASPIVIGAIVMAGTAGPVAAVRPLGGLHYPLRLWGEQGGVAIQMVAILTIAVIYLLIAFVFFALAGANLRKRIFHNGSK